MLRRDIVKPPCRDGRDHEFSGGGGPGPKKHLESRTGDVDTEPGGFDIGVQPKPGNKVATDKTKSSETNEKDVAVPE